MKKEKENRIGTLHSLIQQLHRKDKAFQMFVYPKEIEVHTPFKVFTIPFGDSGKERYKEVLEVLEKKIKGGAKS